MGSLGRQIVAAVVVCLAAACGSSSPPKPADISLSCFDITQVGDEQSIVSEGLFLEGVGIIGFAARCNGVIIFSGSMKALEPLSAAAQNASNPALAFKATFIGRTTDVGAGGINFEVKHIGHWKILEGSAERRIIARFETK